MMPDRLYLIELPRRDRDHRDLAAILFRPLGRESPPDLVSLEPKQIGLAVLMLAGTMMSFPPSAHWVHECARIRLLRPRRTVLKTGRCTSALR